MRFDEPEPNRIVEQQVDTRARALERHLGADLLSYVGPIFRGADDAIRDIIESRSKRRQKLAFVLETSGGYIEVVQRIADTLRHHYSTVDFFVPNHAMSAGTVLVMCGDAIYMDYYAVLGPIDPQIELSRGGSRRLVPALGYLVKFGELIEKSARGDLTDAELTFLIERFDPAELHEFEQARELSKTLLKEWLVKYKFKDWNETETNRTPVTEQMKQDRAAFVADTLNNTKKWHTHGRGISMEVLRRDVQLKIDDFGATKNKELGKSLRAYYKGLTDYFSVLGIHEDSGSALHVPGNHRVLMWR